jgi:hypothetical protein
MRRSPSEATPQCTEHKAERHRLSPRSKPRPSASVYSEQPIKAAATAEVQQATGHPRGGAAGQFPLFVRQCPLASIPSPAGAGFAGGLDPRYLINDKAGNDGSPSM